MNNSNMQDINETLCDDSTYSAKQVIIGGICVPVLIFIGLVTNLMNVTIFSHHRMKKSPINRYLMFLAVCDLVNLFCASFIIPMPIFAELSASPVLYDIAATGILFAYPVGQAMHTISIYLTVLVSGFRFLAVCFPFESERICTMTNVKRSILAISLVSVLYNFSRFFELQIHFCHSYFYGANVLELSTTELRRAEFYVVGYLGWSYTFTLLVVPFTLLIIMNLRVVCEVRRSRKSHLYSLCSSTDENANRMNVQKERSTTIMLMGIVFVFICCNFPALVSNVMEIIIRSYSIESSLVLHWYGTIVSMSNLLVLANMGINFFIYYGFSERYRTLLKRSVCGGELCHKRSFSKSNLIPLVQHSEIAEIYT